MQQQGVPSLDSGATDDEITLATRKYRLRVLRLLPSLAADVACPLR